MGDLQMSNMIIKSSVKNYEVIFAEDKNLLMSDYSEKDVIIVDKNVKKLWSSLFNEVTANVIEIEATEKTKSYYQIGEIIQKLIDNGFKKNGKIIAVGGGITQDICGFISSIMFRGVEWEFYPTTLLAQGDSCIGGKTSVNFGDYKNQLGNFNPPNKIIVYGDFVDTLPDLDIRSGIGEMLHFYLVSSRTDFDLFKSHRNPKSLIKRCLEIKKGFIEIDEFDKKERLVLNYGHTFGHAIESITNHTIPHGIAVSMGMDMANYISMKKGYIDESIYKEVNHVIKGLCHDIEYDKFDVNELITALKKDKKNISSNIMCVLTKGIGNMFLEEIDIDSMTGYLTEYIGDK